MTEDEYDYFKSKSRQTSGRVVIDFVDLFINNNLNENIVLRKGDIITIPEQKDYIIMLGQFVNPGKIIYEPDLTIKDYIALAEGFGWRALEGEVRVIKATTGEWIDADDVGYNLGSGRSTRTKILGCIYGWTTNYCTVSCYYCSNCGHNYCNEVNDDISRNIKYYSFLQVYNFKNHYPCYNNSFSLSIFYITNNI
jgi:hypothetical protein